MRDEGEAVRRGSLRVLFVDQYSTLGGGQRILRDVVRHFRDRGHESEVALPLPGLFAEALQAEGFPVHAISPLPMRTGRKSVIDVLRYPLAARRVAAALGSLAVGRGADLIYANGPRLFIPALSAGARSGLAVVCAVHLIFRRGIAHRVVRRSLRHPCLRSMLFCSATALAPFARDGVPARARLVQNWVAKEFLESAPRREESRGIFGLGPSELAVGVLGRISRTKGQRLFLQALLPLLGLEPRLRLLIAGGTDFEDSTELDILRRMIAAGPAPERIHLMGNAVDAVTFLDALDILVVPSVGDEAFGLVAVEGMARGLPVVATRDSSLAEIVDEGTTGLLVAKEAAALRSAVEILLADRELSQRMARAGRRRAQERYAPQGRLDDVLAHCLPAGDEE